MFYNTETQTELDQIFKDHSYAFSETQHKDNLKNYYLNPYYQHPRPIMINYNDNVDIEEIEGETSPGDNCTSHFNKIYNFILKSLYGKDYIANLDQDSKIDFHGVEGTDKSKFSMWYKYDDWTISENNFRLRLFGILEDGYGSLIMVAGNQTESCFNAIIHRISKQISNAYSCVHWRLDICSSVHAHLLEYLSDELLVIYIESFRHLSQRIKMKTIIEQLNNWAPTHKILQRFSWSTFLQICQREIREENDDLSNIQWPLEPKLRPMVIHIYPERWTDSSRMNKFSAKLRAFCNVIEFKFDDSGRLRKKFETLRNMLQNELKNKKYPIFVMGWDLGALLGLLSSIKTHGINATNFSGVICLGLPLKGLKGERGVIPEDYIHLLSKETLIVSGDMSGIGDGDDFEDFKDRMKGRVSIRHINIGGCDHILRLSSGYGFRYKLSQEIVDMTILKEVRNFIIDQVSSIYLKSDVNDKSFHSRNDDYRHDFYTVNKPVAVFNTDRFINRI